MNEVKMADAKCFVVDCGRNMAWESFGGSLFQLVCPHCRYRPPKATTESGAIQNHLALCSDNEKGRKYDREVPCSFCGGGQRMPIVEQHLGVAVRLLGVKQGQRTVWCNYEQGLAVREELSCRSLTDKEIDTFLAQDAIVTILKQKGQ